MSISTTFILPPKDEIARVMNDLSLQHMDEKTKLSKTLGGEKKNALGLNMAWELAFADYIATMGPTGRITSVTTSMLKPLFIKKLLSLAGQEASFKGLVDAGLCDEK